MKSRRMRLVAFLLAGPTAHHHGMWRHPETDNAFLTPEYYEHVARVLEGGFFDALFFADILALMDFYKGSYETVLSRGGQMGLLDPMPMLAQMARVTKHIGLGGSVSSSFVHAFQTARTFATLDHLSSGRMAWNIVTTSSSPQWANFGLTPMPRDERYDVADEVVEACTRLWDSWEPDALIIDKASGRFADASKVHPVNYNGKYVATRGPLTVPRTIQGWPVLMQAGSSPRGRAFDSGGCDGFVLTPTTFPGRYEQFSRSVVPELQRRGLVRTRYQGRTLRENLQQ